MTIRLRTIFFATLVILFIWFLFLERAILTPFILSAIFAYIFNPVVNFFYHKIKIPRIFSVIIIYFILVASIIVFGFLLTKRVISESSEFKDYINHLSDITKEQINTLPDWLRPAVNEVVSSLNRSKLFSPDALFTLFPQAISRIVSFFIFLFSGFYFLKEGREMTDKLLNFVPNAHRIDVEILLRKINAVFAGYLRGQIFLILIVSGMLFIALSILGLKFALIIAVFSGFAEIIPYIGPITAGTIAALVAILTGGVSNFSINPIESAIVIGIIYFVTRQFQDYFITPHIMGRITKIHPLLILFAVLAGGHLFGILGFILAVPVAATIKILLEFFLDKINEENISTSLRK